MRSFDTCRCGSETFVARATTDTSIILDAGGEVVDRTSSDAVEDVECAACGRIARDLTQLACEEVDVLLDATASNGGATRSSRATGEAGTGGGCDPERRLTWLVAALLSDNEEHYPDVYERHVVEDNEPCPRISLVELTEKGCVEVLAEGREYVLRVQPKHS